MELETTHFVSEKWEGNNVTHSYSDGSEVKYLNVFNLEKHGGANWGSWKMGRLSNFPICCILSWCLGIDNLFGWKFRSRYTQLHAPGFICCYFHTLWFYLVNPKPLYRCNSCAWVQYGKKTNCLICSEAVEKCNFDQD